MSHIIWNPNPVLLELGPLQLRWYGLLIAVAVFDPAIASVLADVTPIARARGLLVNLEYFDGRKRLGATIPKEAR